LNSGDAGVLSLEPRPSLNMCLCYKISQYFYIPVGTVKSRRGVRNVTFPKYLTKTSSLKGTS
jgi:hypothetical protein